MAMRQLIVLGLVTALAGAAYAKDDAARLSDHSNGTDWAGYGRTFGEQHYSPLRQINTGTIGKLGLAWSYDLETANADGTPLEVDGTLFVVTGYGVVRALDAITGKLLWTFDAKAPEAAGQKLRGAWGVRGIGYWNGKIYLGAYDGRLIAIDAKTGQQVWSVLTTEPGDGRYITGAPRLFNGKVIIGHGGADFSSIRGYVTTYDAETGKQLWRFYLVPGDPAKGFENKTMEMAAKTWAGEWWKYGGGGNVWNSFTYDAESDTIFLGTGNGSPWNHRIRSQGKGDNLFVCSVVALNATTGEYKWHYQFNPGETWDYNASMDMALADLKIDGQARKVLMTVPKNGFYYVIDRTNGKLISAKPIAKVTWASGIDLATGRPIENPDARFPDGKSFVMWPGTNGAHNWHAMAFSPKTGLAYIPTFNLPALYSDKGVVAAEWKPTPGMLLNAGESIDMTAEMVRDPDFGKSWLTAWNPVTQTVAWKIPTPALWNGGALATAGDLVFQGQSDGQLKAYEAATGQEVWHFAAQAPLNGAAITYTVKGKQYVTVVSGISALAALYGTAAPSINVEADYRKTPRRVLTFALGGEGTLPQTGSLKQVPLPDPTFKPDQASAGRGADTFGQRCRLCHGGNVVSGGLAPDLRTSPIPRAAESFSAVVHDGALVPHGMPRFEELTHEQLEDLRQYIRTEGDRFNKSTRAEQTQ